MQDLCRHVYVYMNIAINPKRISDYYTAFKLLLLAATHPNNQNVLYVTTFTSQVEVVPPNMTKGFREFIFVFCDKNLHLTGLTMNSD